LRRLCGRAQSRRAGRPRWPAALASGAGTADAPALDMTNSSCIAVGVDFSGEADRAAIEAREIARHLHDELVLVHAASRQELGDFLTLTGAASVEWTLERERQAVHRVNHMLGDMRERISSDGVTIRQALIQGDADSALGDAANEIGAEMIVVGTHGRTGVAWALLGSVSEKIIRAAEVDVVIARDPEPPRGGYRRIMVATDFSPSAARAYQRALALAAPDAVIEVVHFFRGRPDTGIEKAAESIGIALERERLERTLAAGQSLIGERCLPGQPWVRFYAVEQAPVDGITHWLASEPFDLVALGSHGRRGVRRFILGSVSEAIARRAPCSVLVARGPAPKDLP
jgi:nucleotide-binding universal stress UspA family protein